MRGYACLLFLVSLASPWFVRPLYAAESRSQGRWERSVDDQRLVEVSAFGHLAHRHAGRRVQEATSKQDKVLSGGKLTEGMLIENRKSRAGGIKFFDPPKEILNSRKTSLFDFQFRFQGSYAFRLSGQSDRLRLSCGLSDDIRERARYSLRVFADDDKVLEDVYEFGDELVTREIDVSGVETLVMEVAGAPTGDFMLFYCRSKLT